MMTIRTIPPIAPPTGPLIEGSAKTIKLKVLKGDKKDLDPQPNKAWNNTLLM